jgi:hypothetical protein
MASIKWRFSSRSSPSTAEGPCAAFVAQGDDGGGGELKGSDDDVDDDGGGGGGMSSKRAVSEAEEDAGAENGDPWRWRFELGDRM